MPKWKFRKKKAPKRALALPDLEHVQDGCTESKTGLKPGDRERRASRRLAFAPHRTQLAPGSFSTTRRPVEDHRLPLVRGVGGPVGNPSMVRVARLRERNPRPSHLVGHPPRVGTRARESVGRRCCGTRAGHRWHGTARIYRHMPATETPKCTCIQTRDAPRFPIREGVRVAAGSRSVTILPSSRKGLALGNARRYAATIASRLPGAILVTSFLSPASSRSKSADQKQ